MQNVIKIFLHNVVANPLAVKRVEYSNHVMDLIIDVKQESYVVGVIGDTQALFESFKLLIVGCRASGFGGGKGSCR